MDLSAVGRVFGSVGGKGEFQEQSAGGDGFEVGEDRGDRSCMMNL